MFYDVYRCFRWVAPQRAFKGALKCSFFPTVTILSLFSPRQEPGTKKQGTTMSTAEQCFFQMQYGKSHVYIKQFGLTDCGQGTC